MALRPLTCVGPKDGITRTFFYGIVPEPGGPPPEEDFEEGALTVRVYDRDPPVEGEDWYEAEFRKPPDETYEIQVTMLENRGRAKYMTKGITEAVFSLVASLSDPFPGDERGPRELVSSSDKRACLRFDNEARSEAAESVWKRLRAAGRATYDETVGRYRYVPAEV